MPTIVHQSVNKTFEKQFEVLLASWALYTHWPKHTPGWNAEFWLVMNDSIFALMYRYLGCTKGNSTKWVESHGRSFLDRSPMWKMGENKMKTWLKDLKVLTWLNLCWFTSLGRRHNCCLGTRKDLCSTTICCSVDAFAAISSHWGHWIASWESMMYLQLGFFKWHQRATRHGFLGVKRITSSAFF